VIHAQEQEADFIAASEAKAAEVTSLPATNKVNAVPAVSRDFRIIIPSINVDKQVVPNVDPSDKEEYLGVLNYAVAHGKYTPLPNAAIEDGNVYLFAHRAGNYQGRDIGFFRDLDKLGQSDELTLIYDGHTYIYRFNSSKIVSPKDVYVYTPFSDSPTLSLQTCESGQAKRLILKFDLVGWY
jgi:LPXTG-site transpeptidase (sortase) family protein